MTITRSIFPGYLTTAEVAVMHGVTRQAVNLWIAKGQLQCVRQGRICFVAECDAKKFSPPPEGNPNWRLKKIRAASRNGGKASGGR